MDDAGPWRRQGSGCRSWQFCDADRFLRRRCGTAHEQNSFVRSSCVEENREMLYIICEFTSWLRSVRISGTSNLLGLIAAYLPTAIG